MVIGTCDPATRGKTFNVLATQYAGGLVGITVRYGWDGVSTYPNCDGPIIQVQVFNNDSVSWWVHTVGRKGQPIALQMVPGFSATYTGAQLATLGFNNKTDLDELTLSKSAVA